MITKENIEKLAKLARVNIDSKEIEKFAGEANDILNYMGQINEALGKDSSDSALIGKVKNVCREDRVKNNSGEYTDALLRNSPDKDGDYFKVKKIL